MLVTKIMQPNCLYVSHIDLSMKPHFWWTDPGQNPTQNKERERDRSHIFKMVHESTRSPTITNLIRENVFSKCNHIVCRPTLTIYKNNNHPTNGNKTLLLRALVLYIIVKMYIINHQPNHFNLIVLNHRNTMCRTQQNKFKLSLCKQCWLLEPWGVLESFIGFRIIGIGKF